MKNLIEMKDVRILWNRNEKGQIKGLIVAEFKTPGQNKNLYDHYTSDIGNCRGDWTTWRVLDVIHYLFVCHEFESQDERLKAFQEISKIKEVSEAFPAEITPNDY